MQKYQIYKTIVCVLISILVIKTDLLQAQDVIIMGSTQSPFFVSETALFYDSGGPSIGANYQSGENYILTIEVPFIHHVLNIAKVTFNSYDIHCSDILNIYDGANTSAPLITSICGQYSYIQGECELTYYASGQHLTFEFISDPNPNTTGMGWIAEISSEVITGNPDFIICNNENLFFEDIFPCTPIHDSISCLPLNFGISECAAGCFGQKIYRYVPQITGTMNIELFGSASITAYLGTCDSILIGPFCEDLAYICLEQGRCFNYEVEAGKEYYIIVDKFPPSQQESDGFTIILKDQSCFSHHCLCPQIYAPVCTLDGKIFGNECLAQCAGYWPGQYVDYEDGLCNNSCVTNIPTEEFYTTNYGEFNFQGLEFADLITYYTVLNEDSPSYFEIVDVHGPANLNFICPSAGRWKFCFYYCVNDIPTLLDENSNQNSNGNIACCENIFVCCINVCVDPIPQPVGCGYTAIETFTESCFTNPDLYSPCNVGGIWSSLGPIKIYKFSHQGGPVEITARGSISMELTMKVYEGSDPYNPGVLLHCESFICQSPSGCSLTYSNQDLPAGDYLVVIIGESFNSPIGSIFEITFSCCFDFISGINCAPIFHAFEGAGVDSLSFSFQVDQPGFYIDAWEIDDVPQQGIFGNDPIFSFPYFGSPYTVNVCWIYWDPSFNCYRRCCRQFCVFNPLNCDFVDYEDIGNTEFRLQVNDPEFDGEVTWILDNHPQGPFILPNSNINPYIINLSDYASIISGDFEISARYGTPGCWRFCCIVIPRPPFDCQDIDYEVLDDGLSVNFTRPDGQIGNWEVIDLDGSMIPLAFNTTEISYFNPVPGTRRICWWRNNPNTGLPEYCCRDFCLFNPYSCNFTGFVPLASTSDRFEFSPEIEGQYWEVRNTESNSNVTINNPTPTYTYPGTGVYEVCGYFLNSCGVLQRCCFVRCIETSVCDLTYEVLSETEGGELHVNLAWSVTGLDSMVITGVDDPTYQVQFGHIPGNGLFFPFPGPGRYQVCKWYLSGEIVEFCCKTIYIYPCWPWKFRPVGGNDQVYHFENQGDFPVDRWEVEDALGNLLGSFNGNNVNINFEEYGEFFVTPVIMYPGLCTGYRGCRQRICVQPVFNCNLIRPRPQPIPLPGGGYRYTFDFEQQLSPNATEIQWFVEDIPSSDVVGNAASFDFGPQFYGREVVISVIYFDGQCWRMCCVVICIIDPFNCNEIAFRPVPIPSGLELQFSLPTSYTDIFWELHLEDGTTLAVGDGSEFNPLLESFNNDPIVVSVSYYDPVTSCRRLCCRRICLPDPLSCNFISVTPMPVSLPGGGFGYTAILEDQAEEIEWYWHDEDGNVINGAEGTGAESAITFDSSFEGIVFITYRYYWGGCLRVCCRRICIRNPYTCGLIEWNVGNLTPEDINYTFSTGLPTGSISDVSWKIIDAMSEEVIGTSIAAVYSLNLSYGRMYHVIMKYFDPLSGCWRYCCRKICVEDPFACGDIVVRPRPVLGGPVYLAELNNLGAEDIFWQLDEDLSNNQTGGFSFEVDFTQYVAGNYNITVFYRVGDCWFTCCRQLCITRPLSCTALSAVAVDDQEVMFENLQNLPVENYFVFSPQGDSLDIVNGAASNYVLPGGGNYWFCAYYFVNGCWQYCCFNYNNCDSQINCTQINLTPFSNNGLVNITGGLTSGGIVDSIVIETPEGIYEWISGSSLNYECKLPGNYKFCFYYRNECGFTDFCCIDYCADNFEYPCKIPRPERLLNNLYHFQYTGEEEVISWEIDGVVVAENVQELTFEVNIEGEYEICVIRKTKCGRILDKCCVRYCLDLGCSLPEYSVINNSLSVAFADLDSDTLKVYDSHDNLIDTELISGLNNYTYLAPTTGRYSFCFSYVNGCGGTSFCCIEDICIEGNPVCPPFTFTLNGLDINLTANSEADEGVTWDLGDGNLAHGHSVTHRYLQAGSYRICYTYLKECAICSYCELIVVVPDGALAIKYDKVIGNEGSIVELPVIVASGEMTNVTAFQFFFEIERPEVAVATSVISVSPFTNFTSLFTISGSNNRYGVASSVSSNIASTSIQQGDTLCVIKFKMLGNKGDSTAIKFWSDNLRNNSIADDGIPPNTITPILIDGCIIIPGDNVVLQGNVTTWPPTLGINKVDIIGKNNSGEVFLNERTNIDGGYLINSLIMPDSGVKLSASKSDRQSMASLAGQIQAATVVKFISDPSIFENQGQFIAADFNCNGIIDMFDAFTILQVTFNIGSPLIAPACLNNPWVFVPKNLAIDPVSPQNWYPYPTENLINDQFNENDGDFYGVHRGDILQLSDVSRTSPLVLLADNIYLHEGEEHNMDIVGLNFNNLTSFGIGISFDTSKIEFLGILPETPMLAGHEIVIDPEKIKEGILALGWVYFDLTNPNGVSFTEDELLFSLKWKAKSSGVQLNEVIVHDPEAHPAVGTDKDLNIIPVLFGYDRSVHLNESTHPGYALYQNIPNPFNSRTLIPFTVPYPQEVQLDVFDSLGKQVHSQRDMYPSGTHHIEIENIDISGIYIYRLTTKEFIAAKKFIKH